MRPHTAAYMRVSSRNGRQKTDSQRHAIREYLKRQRIRNVKWYEDKATGRTTKREQLQQILDDCRNGKCKTLVLWTLDRLSRSCRDTLNLLADLMEHGVTIVVVSQNSTLDDTEIGRAVIQLMGLVAELESSFIFERTKVGLNLAREIAVKLGRRADDRKRPKLQRSAAQGSPVANQSSWLCITPAAMYALP